jgi:two-component system phosphate regulon sensor histidine kinase PhoR
MRPAWSGFALALTALFLPVLIVLTALVLFGALAVALAWLAGAAIFIALATICRWYWGRIGQVVRYAHAVAEDRAISPGMQPTGPIVTDVIAAIDHLQGARVKERSRAALRAREEENILDRLPDPIVLLDSDRRVVRANEASVRLIGSSQVGGDLAMVLRHPLVLEAVDAVLSGQAVSREAEFMLPVPQARHFNARVARAPGGLDSSVVAFLILHDLTEAKRSDQMRADFVANASHELRTPLSTLIGFIETLQGPAKDDAPARERFLGIMHEHAERMNRLIKDLLTLSHIEMFEHSPPQSPVDLVSLVHEVAELLQLQAKAKNMPIEIEAPADMPAAIGDRDQLVQVFQNLMDNAIKYGHAGTPIKVKLSGASAFGGRGAFRTGERPPLAVAIADQSDGIPRQHLSRLTERFYRVDSARSRALGGTGLGLAIVKHVINRHRGALTIDSQPGQGSVFTVYLPSA